MEEPLHIYLIRKWSVWSITHPNVLRITGLILSCNWFNRKSMKKTENSVKPLKVQDFLRWQTDQRKWLCLPACKKSSKKLSIPSSSCWHINKVLCHITLFFFFLRSLCHKNAEFLHSWEVNNIFLGAGPSVPTSQWAQGLKQENLTAARNSFLIEYQTSHQGKQKTNSLPLIKI